MSWWEHLMSWHEHKKVNTKHGMVHAKHNLFSHKQAVSCSNYLMVAWKREMVVSGYINDWLSCFVIVPARCWRLGFNYFTLLKWKMKIVLRMFFWKQKKAGKITFLKREVGQPDSKGTTPPLAVESFPQIFLFIKPITGFYFATTIFCFVVVRLS